VIRHSASALTLAICAGVGVGPVFGQTPSATAAAPGKARPAESGAHDSAATLGPLAIGADVRDPTGADIGRLVLITTDKAGRSVAKIRLDEDVYLVPLAELRSTAAGVVSRLTLDELKHGGGGIAAGGAR
jgi:hypothetical protein